MQGLFLILYISLPFHYKLMLILYARCYVLHRCLVNFIMLVKVCLLESMNRINLNIVLYVHTLYEYA